jgi:hypothetical protein
MNDDPFGAHRSLLFTVAYEMLGSAADAEDVVQEAWLRWADVDQSEVRDPRAYLVRVVTRKAPQKSHTIAAAECLPTSIGTASNCPGSAPLILPMKLSRISPPMKPMTTSS